MSTLKLLREIRESGDKTPYASLLKRARQFDDGGKRELSKLSEDVNNTIASTTYFQPAPIPRIYSNKERDTGSISIGDSSKKMRDTQETPEEYWSYRNEIKRNIERMGKSMDKVGDKLISPAIALTSMAIAGPVGNLIGSAYFGNKMSESEDPLAEGTSAIIGQLKSPVSETAKKIGGFNDLKTSYNEFKKGNYKSGVYNLATGVGGIYDSKWFPNIYSGVIDKGLEVLNLYGDTKDTYEAVKFHLDNKSN